MRGKFTAGMLVLAGLLVWAVTAKAQWTIKGPTEDSFIKIGFLLQGQAEWIDLAGTRKGIAIESDDVAQNLFVRRMRILMGGQINSKLSFFFETDSPNLGKYDTTLGKFNAAGVYVPDKRKNDGGIYIQDFFATYAFADEFKIDFGLMLIPLSHNSEQSAATLLPIDYGSFTFATNARTTEYTQSRVGRDYGVQLRGYVFDKHLEYRAGVYQGNRDLGKQGQQAQQVPFRYAGRVVVHFLDPEDGFFYTGTTLGKKNIFSIGMSADVQGNSYKAYAADLFWDQPIGEGDAITLQLGYIYMDGSSAHGVHGDPYFNLMAQNDYLAEFGYFNQATKLGFFAQWGEQNYVQTQFQDEKRYSAGLVYWGLGHNFNVKAGYGVLYTERTHKKNHIYRDQYLVQCQVFMY
jgi:hypothetical protein